jgi:PAS domain S-box-containing protein
MPHHSPQPVAELLLPAARRPSPLRIAVGYLVAGLVWVWASDAALYAAGAQTDVGFLLAGGKGTLFFLLTAVALFWLVRRDLFAVTRANALLMAVAEGTTDAVFVKDRDGRYLLFNSAAGRLVGRPVAEVLGRDDTALFDPAGVARVRETDRRVIESGTAVTVEERITATAAGVERVYLATKAPLRDEQGAAVGVVGISRDITDRVRAEDEARAQAEFAQGVLDAVAASVAVLDRDGTVIAVNAAWQAFAAREGGTPGGTGVGANYLAVCAASAGPECRDGAAAAEAIRRVLAGEADGATLDYPCHSPTEQRWFLMNVTPLRRGRGAAVVAHTNVTPLRLAETAVRRSEERARRGEALLSAVLEALPLSVIIADEGGRVVRMNPASLAIWGPAPMSAGVDEYREYVGYWPDTGRRIEPREWPMARAVLAGETSVGVRVQIDRFGDGARRLLELSAAPVVGDDGRRLGGVVACKDVTDRVRAEEELRAERDRFQKLVETAPAAICSFELRPDGTMCFPYASRKVEEIYGVSRERLAASAEPVFAMTHPDDAEAVRASVAASARDLLVWHAEFRIAHPTRGERWLEGRSAPVRRADGSTLWHGFVTDVTDRRRAADEAARMRNLLRQVIDTVPYGVFWKDPESRHLGCNVTVARALGFDTPEEVVGRADTDLPGVTPEQAEVFMRVDREVVRSGVARLRVSEQLTRADGSTVWLETNKLPLRDAAGRVVGVIGTWEDVTDRRRTELALQESEARLHEAQRIARLGSWTWEPSTGRVWWSAAIRELFGVPPDAAPSFEAFVALLHPDDRVVARDRVARVLGGADGFADDLRIVRPDGRVVWIRSEARATRDDAGRLLRVEGIDQDITDRKLADEALRESEWRLRFTLEAAAAGTWSWDARVADTRWDDQFHANYGFGPDQPRNFDAWIGSIHPDDRPRVLARVEQMRATPGDDRWEMEFRARHAGRGDRWHYGLGRCERDPAGGIARVFGIDIDVTDRKQAEAALRESEERFRSVFEHAATGIAITDPDGRFLRCNPAYCAVLGRTEEEMLAADLAELIHPDDRAENMALLRRLAAGEIPRYEVENRFLHKSGEPRWVHKWVTALGVESGRAVCLLALVTDVTEQRRADAALREGEKRLRLAVQAANVGLWDWDVKADRVHFSPEWKAQLGYAPEEVGDSVAEWESRVHPDDVGPALEQVRRTFAGPDDSHESEFRMRHKDGSWRWIFTRAVLFRDAAGAPARMLGGHLDITARKQAEFALRESEERLRLALTAAAAIGFVWDAAADSVVRYFSSVPALPTNVDAPESVAAVRARVHPDDLGRFDAGVADCLRTGTEYRNLYRVMDRPGSVMWLQEWGALARDAAGRPLRLTGISIDVTDRMRADEALRAGEERYRRLVEGLPEAVFINADDRVAYCNPACVALFGAADATALLGKSPLDLFAPEYHDAIRARVRDMQETGAPVSGLDERIVRLDGRTAPVHVVAIPIVDGGRSAILVCLRDLSERERTLGLLRTVLGSVGDAILTIDAAGRVESANPATERLFGYSEAELVGQNVRALMPEPDRGRHDGYIANYLRSGEAKVIGIGREVDGRRKDGTTFPVELTVTEFKLDGERRFTGVLRDITARRRLEDQYRQAQKMEAIGRLAGGVAHDFNNLLTVINGYTDLLLFELPPGEPRRAHVAAVREAGERAAALTAQLLAFSRKALVTPKVFDLKDVAAQSEKLLRRLIGEDVVLTLVLHPARCPVKADPNQVDQVIMNLAVNARDAMPTGGRLTLEVRPVAVPGGPPAAAEAGLRPGRYVELAVADTGCGMTPEVQARIFEPFFTTKGEGQGTGLGLATVFGIVQQAGGHVSVESAVGRGTTFRILLPEVPVAAAEAEPVRPFAARGTEVVLLVEDDAAVRQLSRLALETQGYRVVAAGSGREALDLLQVQPGGIDLMVTDVVMPEMSGRELADAVRAARPGTKVLFVSGYTDDAVVRHGVRNATDAFLQKPFTPLGLARKVRAVLDGG